MLVTLRVSPAEYKVLNEDDGTVGCRPVSDDWRCEELVIKRFLAHAYHAEREEETLTAQEIDESVVEVTGPDDSERNHRGSGDEGKDVSR